MVDLASPILGSFQDNLNDAFGDDLGWVLGHSLITLAIVMTWAAWTNRNHIQTQSGWSRSTFREMAILAMLTLLQVVIYVNNFTFPIVESLGLAIAATLILRWFVNVLN